MCTTHSESIVYDVGLAALGYPPTWAATATEFRTVIEAMGKKQ